jgi:hypothetical protein
MRRLRRTTLVDAVAVWLGGKAAASKSARYELLYALPWAEVTTNNFGFAPAPGNHPERFQLQMYAELYKRLLAAGGSTGARLWRSAAVGAAACAIWWPSGTMTSSRSGPTFRATPSGSAMPTMAVRGGLPSCAATPFGYRSIRQLRRGGERRGIARLWRRCRAARRGAAGADSGRRLPLRRLAPRGGARTPRAAGPGGGLHR